MNAIGTNHNEVLRSGGLSAGTVFDSSESEASGGLVVKLSETRAGYLLRYDGQPLTIRGGWALRSGLSLYLPTLKLNNYEGIEIQI